MRNISDYPTNQDLNIPNTIHGEYCGIVSNIMGTETELITLKEYLAKIPSINPDMSSGIFENGCWWVKFQIDTHHELAWRVVQELGHMLNYMSLNDRLPTVFMPVSPPPYMNGGPTDFLSWVIESKDKEFEPATCAEWLEGRLPRPVDDLKEWEPFDERA